MILTELSKHFQEKNDEIIQNKSCVTLLIKWVKEILKKSPTNNVEKIIHAEIALAENKAGDYFLVAKSDSGRKLTETLYNFALSYEQHVLNKWLQDKKANDFN